MRSNVSRDNSIDVQMYFRARRWISGLIAVEVFLFVGRTVPVPAAEPSIHEALPADPTPADGDGLLETPSLEEPALDEDPANPFGLPLHILTPPTASATTPQAPDPASGSVAQQEYLTDYSVNNPLTRTALQNSRSTGDRFFDGFGGVPRPLDSPLIPRALSSDYLLRLGPLEISPVGPSLSYNMTFGSNNRASGAVDHSFGASGNPIGLSNGSNSNSNGDFGTVSGGFSAELGEPTSGHFVTLNYGASYSFGSGQENQNNPGQTLTLLGQYDFTRLKLGLGIAFDSLSGDNREFGGDIQRELATVAFTSSYAWTPKTSFEWDLSVPIAQYSGGINSSGLTSTTSVNYAYSTKTTFGLGFTTGFTGVAGADTQTFEQVNCQMTSTASPFLSYTGSVGFEWRDTGETRSTSPVFGLGATWTPRVGTSFTLAVDQQVENSAAIAGANYTSTSVTLSCAQRLGSLISLGASIGYERASYTSTLSDQTVDRLDQTLFGQVSISRTVFRRVAFSATVSYYHTASNDLPQTSTQVTVSASYSF